MGIKTKLVGGVKKQEVRSTKVKLTPELLISLTSTASVKAICRTIFGTNDLPQELHDILMNRDPSAHPPAVQSLPPEIRKIWNHLSIDARFALYATKMIEMKHATDGRR